MNTTVTKKASSGPWAGFSHIAYFILFAVVMAASYMGISPKGFLGAMTYCLIFGIFFTTIGNKISFVKNYLGGGSIINLFAGSILVYFGLIPQQTLEAVSALGDSMDLYGFVCMGLIMGSVLGMSRDLLMKAGARCALPILGCVLVGSIFTMVGGLLTGYGAWSALFRVGFPVFGAGVASGAVPMSQIYEAATGIPSGDFLSQLMPVVAISNALAVVLSGALDALGKKHPSLTGNGSIMKNFTAEEVVRRPIDVGSLSRGLIITGTFMAGGLILAQFVPFHYYACTILLCAIAKLCNLIPETLIEDTRQWYDFIAKTCTPAIIAVTGIANIDLTQLIDSFNIRYLILVVLAVVGCLVGATLVGRLVGFYPIEAGLVGGLCMANMGGSGDVACLAASNRMELMPFAQISSRFGGAFIIILVDVVAQIVGVVF